MVARLPIRLCDPEAKPLTKPSAVQSFALPGQGDAEKSQVANAAEPFSSSPTSVPWCDVPIVVHEEVVGRITTGTAAQPGNVLQAPVGASMDVSTRMLRYLGLMANVISRMCDREKQLRTRVEELAALYRITAEFTNRRDLQSLLNFVATSVVEVLGVKACSIRLLSEDRKELVIKAVANMSQEYLNKGPIVVAQSKIDNEVISTLKPVYIADERTDPRIMYPAEAKREGIVSALVAPLVYKGHPEGVIRVYSGKKHKFDWFEESLLMAIAGEAATAIVNSRLNDEAAHAATMRRALGMAAEVQRRMIPSQPPNLPGFQVAALYVPTYELGGDFYDFIDLPPDNMGFAICDVVGKGVRASLLMASIRASLRAHATGIYEMSEVVGRVNRDLCADVLSSDFATLFYGVLDYKSRRFTYTNAGHPSPLLIRAGQTCAMSSGGLPLGIEPAAKWGWDSFVVKSGDVILAYTDGLSEAMNFEDVAFGSKRVEQAALAAIGQGKNAEGILRHVLWEMRRFAGLQTRFDDLTLLAIKVL